MGGSKNVKALFLPHKETSTRTYYRVLCVDCSEDDAFDKLSDIFDKVFHHMAMRVLVETIEEETHVAEVVNKLRELATNLHFTQ